MPVTVSTRSMRAMAHALRAQGLMQGLSSTAGWRDLSANSSILQHMLTTVGSQWKELEYEIFLVAAPYAQSLRLAQIAPEPGVQTPSRDSAAAASPPRARRSLRRRLLDRSAVRS